MKRNNKLTIEFIKKANKKQLELINTEYEKAKKEIYERCEDEEFIEYITELYEIKKQIEKNVKIFEESTKEEPKGVEENDN